MKTKICFLGLGNMGLPIVKNLIEAGYHVQVYNRSISKADELDQSAITRCSTPAEAATDVKFVLSILSDDEVVREAITGEDGILMTMAEDAIHISMSTISPETSKEMADLHEESGSHYLTSPVFGRPDAAAAKKLWVCISGQRAIKDLAKPILETIGQGVIDFGEDVRAANVVKLTGNFMILASLELMSEAYTLAEKYNVDRNAVSEFLSSTLFSAPIFKNYGKLIAQKQYEPVGFKAKLGYKDARLAFQLSQLSETPMPLVSLIHNRMLSAVAKGWGERDWVEAISRGVTDDAGL